ncbi:MBL fold metallo-hydrolase [Rhodobacteraceae bacterium NNCM2]|nr:MBL fold metallo-hydrolase [Coraliihabitans acroporae]
MAMKIKFWGTRGSIPTPAMPSTHYARIRAILKEATPADIADEASIDAFVAGGCRGALPTDYGGNTACVQVTSDDKRELLIDFGSGARELAAEIMATRGPVSREPYHVLMSHLHWDHIMGFPFFVPAYIPGNVIHIYSCHPEAEEAFHRQHGAPSFPVPFEVLGAEIHFHTIDCDSLHEINGFEVQPFLLQHSGDAYAYRIKRGGGDVVYASDGEHKPHLVRDEYPYVDFIRGTQLLIFDAQYSLAETVSIKEDWGHSSNFVGVELALLGGVKRLLFVHHEPLNTDEKIDAIVAEARQIERMMRENREPVEVAAAYDGLEIEL